MNTLFAILLVLAATATHADFASAGGNIVVSDAYARATIAPVNNGAVYLRIQNSGGEADRLRGAATGAADRAELHMHKNDGGVMTMTEVKCLGVPAGGTVTFAPGALHVMLFGVKSPLIEGGEIELTLRFDKAGEVAVKVPVLSATAGSGGQDSHPHDLQLCD